MAKVNKKPVKKGTKMKAAAKKGPVIGELVVRSGGETFKYRLKALKLIGVNPPGGHGAADLIPCAPVDVGGHWECPYDADDCPPGTRCTMVGALSSAGVLTISCQ